MKTLFNKTREVSMAQFEAMWANGGYTSIGNQYSNMDKADYLQVVDRDAEKLKTQKESELEAFHASIPTYTMMGGGRYPERIEDECKLQEMRAELRAIDVVVTNVAETFNAGWVSHSTKATPPHTSTTAVSALPDAWDECYLVYRSYPTFERKLVARNNMDGTVQLFRA